MPTATLGLGSNVGDRLGTLQSAVDLLALEGVRVLACSRVWETDPVGPPQPDFLNAVVLAETNLDPNDVLAACQRVESALGRVRAARWGPRTIDVDVLLYDDLVLDEPNLVIPHPRLTERAFVLLPLLEVTPDPVLPDGTRLRELRLGPGAVGGARPFAPPLRLPAG